MSCTIARSPSGHPRRIGARPPFRPMQPAVGRPCADDAGGHVVSAVSPDPVVFAVADSQSRPVPPGRAIVDRTIRSTVGPAIAGNALVGGGGGAGVSRGGGRRRRRPRSAARRRGRRGCGRRRRASGRWPSGRSPSAPSSRPFRADLQRVDALPAVPVTGEPDHGNHHVRQEPGGARAGHPPIRRGGPARPPHRGRAPPLADRHWDRGTVWRGPGPLRRSRGAPFAARRPVRPGRADRFVHAGVVRPRRWRG